jgi:HEAT repeat protein
VRLRHWPLPPGLRPFVSALAQETDALVQARIAGALGQLKDAKAEAALVPLLQPRSHWAVRKSAAEALARLGTASALQALRTLANDPHPLVRAASGPNAVAAETPPSATPPRS